MTQNLNPPKKAGFLNHIHNFRGVAILFVVAGHIQLYWKPNAFMEKALESLFQNGTVLFVFIAGYLFQYLSKKYDTRTYWSKKLKFVIVPYFAVSIPGIIYRLMTVPERVLEIHPDFGSWELWQQIGWFLITGGHLLPLWFVPMITLFYIIAPLLIFMDRHPVYYWVLPFLVILSVLVPRDQLADIPRMFAHFLSVYVFGMFFSRYDDKIHSLSEKIYIPLTIITIGITVLSLFQAEYYGTIMYIQKMLFCWFFMYWLKRVDRFVPKFFSSLAEYSFGIFFLHYYFLLGLRLVAQSYNQSWLDGNLVIWVIHFTLIIILNMLVIFVVKRFFVHKSRYLIGC